jgi:hypothetical protein
MQPAPLTSSRPGTSLARGLRSAPPGNPARAQTAPPARHEPLFRTPAGSSSSDGGDNGAGSGAAGGSASGGGGVNQRWRLLSFLSRDGEATRDVDDPAELSTSSGGPDVVTESPRPRKGDVVCLSYRTLDDRGMRRLEGRSDHRPVIGVYAIYA